MVTPEDQDIFFISASKATEACRRVIKDEERVTRFTQDIIFPLKKWCEQHASEISACYMVMPESAVLPVYMIGASDEYDFGFTKALSDLALSFEEQGWAVHTSQLPKCSDEELLAFFNPEMALVVYG